jgi:N-acetylmuramic acid 6-phosphate etherase
MNKSWSERSDDFLKISAQFKLGALVTEGSHAATANLSDVARADLPGGLKLLFDADDDVMRKYREFVASSRADTIKSVMVAALKNGGRIFFTGCGSTGRLSILLDSVWRDFWQQTSARDAATSAQAKDWENRTFSVMAGGDFALIKSVEGFEDFTAFGKKQMTDLKVSNKDVVFAITEGGETSFVIGTAWAGIDAGARVYFVYNNPDDILCQHVERSRQVIQDARIEKINLTTGPMSITGSTRMQATSIQLCVMLTVLEMAARELTGKTPLNTATEFLAPLEQAFAALKSPGFLKSLAQLVAVEENVYRSGHKNSYFAGRFGIDVLTDTTERSPTYCTPPFRKFDDGKATESWAFLFLAADQTETAWQAILKRAPRCVEWSETEVRQLVAEENVERTLETVKKIRLSELMRYKIGSNGMSYRTLKTEDCAVAVMAASETAASQEFQLAQLEAARKTGAHTGLVYFGPELPSALKNVAESVTFVSVPRTDLLLDGVTRVIVKLVMNTLSTCTMVRLGRVMGNYMIWVVPSNLKLIDRATRYITKLTNLDYQAANRLLFEILVYVEPRMKADQAYPPVVGMAVLRAKDNLTNEQAEEKLKALQRS